MPPFNLGSPGSISFTPVETYFLWDKVDFFNPLEAPFLDSSFFEITSEEPWGHYYGHESSNNQSVKGDLRGNGIYLGAGNDVANGYAGNDTIYGNGGNDILQGWSGDDTICGGSGTDHINGGAGNDRLYADFVTTNGEKVAQTVFGGSGDDLLVGGAGADMLDGGSGNDTVSYESAGERVHARLDEFTGSYSDAQGDRIVRVENLIGSAHNDWLYGSSDANRIEGGAGNDMIFGLGGNDVLIGGAGNDHMIGDSLFDKPGRDTFTGGAGADTFQFFRKTDSGLNWLTRDVITDFSTGDLISVWQIDSNLLRPGDQAFRLDAGGRFMAGEVKQLQVATGIILNFNIDADSAAEMSILLQGRTTLLTAADFVL